MKTITISEFGAPSVLHVTEKPVPQIGEKEVLIKVSAAGVNRPDIFQRKGHYPAPKGAIQDIPGLEVSGEIVETGTAVTQWTAGDQICALVPGGGYAEYVAADAGSCLPVPKGMSTEEAAALPEVLFTVWHNVFQRGGLQPDEDVLIYGGSGGIGSMAIQLVHLFGSRPYTLVSTAEKAEYCMELGAHHVINYKTEALPEALPEASIDLILDSLGAAYFTHNMRWLRPEGRLVYINAMQGEEISVPVMQLMQKRIHLTGSTLRARSLVFKKSLADDIRQNAFPLLEHEKFRSMVRYRFPLEEAAAAHELMESRDFTGKIILTTG